MEEDILKKKICKENPFTVPHGYFSCLHKDIMRKLPTQRNSRYDGGTSVMKFFRPLLAVAASLFVAVIAVTAIFHSTVIDRSQKVDHASVVNDNTVTSSIDDANYYIIMDNDDIYNYVSEL